MIRALLAALAVGLAVPASAASMARCEREAGLTAARTTVYRQPAVRGPVVRLAAGRPVYRCERRGTWRRVAFPKPGRRAECNRRPAQCTAGWIRDRGTIDTAG